MAFLNPNPVNLIEFSTLCFGAIFYSMKNYFWISSILRGSYTFFDMIILNITVESSSVGGSGWEDDCNTPRLTRLHNDTSLFIWPMLIFSGPERNSVISGLDSSKKSSIVTTPFFNRVFLVSSETPAAPHSLPI